MNLIHSQGVWLFDNWHGSRAVEVQGQRVLGHLLPHAPTLCDMPWTCHVTPCPHPCNMPHPCHMPQPPQPLPHAPPPATCPTHCHMPPSPATYPHPLPLQYAPSPCHMPPPLPQAPTPSPIPSPIGIKWVVVQGPLGWWVRGQGWVAGGRSNGWRYRWQGVGVQVKHELLDPKRCKMSGFEYLHDIVKFI